jgi:hypothetical protein
MLDDAASHDAERACHQYRVTRHHDILSAASGRVLHA